MITELKTQHKNPTKQIFLFKDALRSQRIGNWLVLLTLLLCETIWYSPIIRKVGFYLDDWSTYANLHISNQDWLTLLKVSLADPRIITRPIEAVVYVASWFAFHDNPLGHHLLNCAFEITAAFFLYLILNRLSGNRSLAFIASLLMLIYPNHDATHYWVTANTITLALALYLFSLWQAIKAAQDQKPICFLYSTLAFFTSLLTYEAFLPLIGITGICLLFLYKQKHNWTQACLQSITALVPGFLCIGAVYYYQREFLTSIRKGFHHSLAISIPHALEVVQTGFSQTISFEAISTYFLRIQETLFDLNVFKCATLILLLAIIALTLFIITDNKKDFSHPWTFLGLGLLIMLGSYTVFAVSPEYLPKLESIMNRINIGASVGASMIIAGMLGILANLPKANHKATYALLLTLTAPIIIFFILADWGWSIPWIRSWTFQKHIINIVKNNKEHFKDSDFVILANCPRYVMWSPLFDGVWDFQSMLRMYLDNPGIEGTVTSDRLQVRRRNIQDISCNYICCTIPYSRLTVFIPNPPQWINIDSPSHFIETIRQHSLKFGITNSTINNWQKELDQSLEK